MTWQKESERHKLASNGIKTKSMNKIGKTDTFNFLNAQFDLAKAKKLIQTHDYELTDYPVEFGIKNYIGDEQHRNGLVHVDWKYARNLPDSDCDVPGILVHKKNGNGFLIDGFHRVAKCHLIGKKSFPVYVIPYEDAMKIANTQAQGLISLT